MAGRILLLVSALALAGLTAPAAADQPYTDVRIRTVAPGGEPVAVAGNVTVTQSAAEPSEQVPLREGTATVRLAGGTPHSIGLDAPGFWAAPASALPVAGSTLEVVLEVRPTGSVKGVVKPPPGSALPTELAIVVESPPWPGGQPAIARGTKFVCPVDARGRWRCEIPAAPVDFVVRPHGFVPHYFWGVEITPQAEHDLGTLQLRTGASLVAWVRPDTVPADARATAKLLRIVAPLPSPTVDRLLRPVAEGTFDERGHVQLAAIPDGSYALEISAAGRATERIEPIEIHERRETALRHAIELRPPLLLRIGITPPADFSGKPWHVAVQRVPTVAAPMPSLRIERLADASGVLEVPDQTPGTYGVTVGDSAGNRFADARFTVQSDADAFHSIAIDAHEVGGVVTVGEKPVGAEIIFGGRSGTVSIRFRANGEGEFSGWLPRSGEWPVDVREPQLGIARETTVVVAAGGDRELRIELSDARISGVVVDRAGLPLAGARVVSRWSGGAAESAPTGAEGEFTIAGLEAGEMLLRASARIGFSEHFTVQLREGEQLENVRLQIAENRELRGRVTSGGLPVAGALVVAQPAQGSAARAVTDLDGGFSMTLPDFVRDGTIYVAAAGKSFQAFAIRGNRDGATLDVSPVGGDLELVTAGNSGGWTVAQNGIVLSLQHLIPWARSLGVGNPFTEGRARLPRVAPGVYTFCRIPQPGDPPKCSSGALAPGGSLTLGGD
jgi:hypothetical protein